MARILVCSFSMLPSPDRHGVQLENVCKALGPRHIVDVLTVRGFEQLSVERTHRARILRVPVGNGDLATRVDTFRRALKRQLESSEYDAVHARDGWCAGVLDSAKGTLGFKLVFEIAL